MNARVSFKAGETIIRQGETGETAYIIESGRVEILVENSRGRLQSMGTRGSGTMIGEMALVDAAPRTATVRAIEDCTLLVISNEDFSRRLQQADPVLRMTAQVILNRYRDILARADVREQDTAAPAEAREVSNAERQSVIESVRLTSEFRNALQSGELAAHYQPIVETRSAEIVGFEALMRWPHPERGFISPNLFIPLAENSGLIVEASLWMLAEACSALKRFEAESGKSGLFMSVNLSSADFVFPTIVDQIRGILERTGVEPTQLHIEITERMLMDQPERTRGVLAELHELGILIAIDDFGTGYSSLSYLHSLHVDVLKIDRSFVSAMLNDPRSMELVRAIVGLGRNLGIKVIAEGVETAEEARSLADLDCDEAQGYFFARPMPGREIPGLLEGTRPRLPRMTATSESAQRAQHVS